MTGPIDLPSSLLTAWGQDTRGGRGPRPGLGLDRILDAGVALAGRDGLGAVSMARVASELGASTMSLYRYVTSKDELLLLMVDRALGPPPPRPRRERSWRAGLTRWAVGVRNAYGTHPWTLKVPITGAPLGPNNVRWLESGLDALRLTGLSFQERVSAVLLVSGFVRNDATLAADIRAAVLAAPDERPPDYGVALSALTDASQFPQLHEAIAAGVFADDEGIEGWEGEFDFGLARVLDGIDVLVTRRATP